MFRKIVILSSLTFMVQVNAKQVPRFSEIARDKDGYVLFMDQEGALAYCRDLGLRLPTIREFAQYSEAQGSRGIRELNEAVTSDFSLFETVNSNGDVDYFWFSGMGYVPPRNEIKINSFWSASKYRINPKYAYYFAGEFGVDRNLANDLAAWHAVMCVK